MRARRLHALVDVVILAAASIAAYGARPPWIVAAQWALLTAAWLFGARVLRRYDLDGPRRPLNEMALTTLMVLGVASLMLLERLAIPALESPRFATFLLVAWPATLMSQNFARSGRGIAPGVRDVVVVGAGRLARHTALCLASDPSRRVCGFLSFAGDDADSRLPAAVLGSTGDLERLFRGQPVDEVYIAGDLRRNGDEMQTVVRTCEQFGIPFALPTCSLRFDRARPTSAALADGYVHYASVPAKPLQEMVKRAIDIGACVVALVVLSPMLLLVAIAIKLDSPGPVLFRQRRVGQYGHEFSMLKFRSMCADAEALRAKLAEQNEQSGPVFKIKVDPRITRVGRFIRKYSIDELPQLVNVLRGDMTLVGPRPPLPSEVAQYEPWQRRRLSVRPGLTCIWQVAGRNSVPFERWMYLDMQYIDHWSLALDLRLIARTFAVVVSGRDAS